MESSFAFEPTVIDSSLQPPADKGTIKKRSRYHNCDDDSDDDHGRKRQKLNLPTDCTPSQASLSVQRLAGEKATARKSTRRHKVSHGCSNRKRKRSLPNIPRSLRSTMPAKRALRSTVSAKRAVQSEFWELDPSGKPHSI